MDDDLSLASLVALVLAVIVMVGVIFPYAIIWSFNTLFDLSIEFGFNTWFAALILLVTLGGTSKLVK